MRALPMIMYTHPYMCSLLSAVTIGVAFILATVAAAVVRRVMFGVLVAGTQTMNPKVGRRVQFRRPVLIPRLSVMPPNTRRRTIGPSLSSTIVLVLLIVIAGAAA